MVKEEGSGLDVVHQLFLKVTRTVCKCRRSTLVYTGSALSPYYNIKPFPVMANKIVQVMGLYVLRFLFHIYIINGQYTFFKIKIFSPSCTYTQTHARAHAHTTLLSLFSPPHSLTSLTLYSLSLYISLTLCLSLTHSLQGKVITLCVVALYMTFTTPEAVI